MNQAVLARSQSNSKLNYTISTLNFNKSPNSKIIKPPHADQPHAENYFMAKQGTLEPLIANMRAEEKTPNTVCTTSGSNLVDASINFQIETYYPKPPLSTSTPVEVEDVSFEVKSISASSLIKSVELIFEENATQNIPQNVFLNNKKDRPKLYTTAQLDSESILDKYDQDEPFGVDKEALIKSIAKIKATCSLMAERVEILNEKNKRLQNLVCYTNPQVVALKFKETGKKLNFENPFRTIQIQATNLQSSYTFNITADPITSKKRVLKDYITGFDLCSRINEMQIVCNLFPQSCRFLYTGDTTKHPHTCLLNNTEIEIKSSSLTAELFEEFIDVDKCFGIRANYIQVQSLKYMAYWVDTTVKKEPKGKQNLLGALVYLKTHHLKVKYVEIVSFMVAVNYNKKMFQGIIHALSLVSPNICYTFTEYEDYEMMTEMGYYKFTSKLLDPIGFKNNLLVSPTFNKEDLKNWL